MAQKVLYREWRPQNFDEVVGQGHVVQALRQSVVSGEIAHAYLFSGTRGTGKTSLAKIFARAVNCLNLSDDGNPCNQCETCTGILNGSLLDVVEMDAASNNSVDNIRKITDEVLFLPTLAKYKVYIIDEVHMLSTAAFNALLKTLEEPPAHVIFILATTDPQRIPATILSRCQRYDFKRISAQLMQKRLEEIAQAHDIAIDEDAIALIINRSEGALRDAISLLDQSRSVYTGSIGRDEILQMTGVVNDELLEGLVSSLHEGDTDGLLRQIDHLIMEGGDLQRFVSSLSAFYRDILVCKMAREPEKLLLQSKSTLTMMKNLASRYSQASIIEQITHLTKLQLEMKQSQSPRITLEVGLIEMLNLREIISQDQEAQASNRTKSVEEPAPQAPKAEKPTPQAPQVEEPAPQAPKAEKPTPQAPQAEEPAPQARQAEEPTPQASQVEKPTLQLDPGPLAFDLAQDQVPKPEPDPTPELELEPETPIEEQVVEDVDLDLLWQTFMKALSDSVPLLAIIMNGFSRHIEGKSLVIDIPQDNRAVYDKIKDDKTWNALNNIFKEQAPSREWRLQCRLGGQELSDEDLLQSNVPEWIRKMRNAAEALQIPLDEDNNKENENGKR